MLTQLYLGGAVRDTTSLIIGSTTDTFVASAKTSRGGFGVLGRLRLWGVVVPTVTASDFNPNAPTWGSLAALPNGVVAQPYIEEWDMPYAASPTTYAVNAGVLPTGLTLGGLGTTGGQLTGTPTVAGTYIFTLRATNIYGTADESFTVTITALSAASGNWGWVA